MMCVCVRHIPTLFLLSIGIQKKQASNVIGDYFVQLRKRPKAVVVGWWWGTLSMEDVILLAKLLYRLHIRMNQLNPPPPAICQPRSGTPLFGWSSSLAELHFLLYTRNIFAHSFCCLRNSLSPCPSVDVTRVRGAASRLFSPLPTAVHAFVFYCEKAPALSSLVHSHGLVPYPHPNGFDGTEKCNPMSASLVGQEVLSKTVIV